MSWKRPRCKCPTCGKNVAVRAPTGDYLDAIFPFRHKAPDGKECDGTNKELENSDLTAEHK